MLITVSGPSCVGKSFCVEYLCNRHGFAALTPYTTRPPRVSESEGIHYHFRSEQELRELTASFSNGYWAQPFGEDWYGYTGHVDELVNDPGNWIIQAFSLIALEIKKRHPAVTTVFLDYKSEEAFFSRLKGRYGTEPKQLSLRQEHAEHERSHKSRFDHVLESDNPEELADRLVKLAFSQAIQVPSTSLSSPGPLSDADVIASLEEMDGIRIEGIPADAVRQQIHGWSFDLTLAPKYYRVTRRRFWRRVFDLAQGNPRDMARRFVESHATNEQGIILKPGEFILASSVERLTLPRNVAGLLSGRSSYARLGLSVEHSQTILQPGHSDTVPLQVTNHLPYPVVLYPGTQVAQVVFFRSVSPAAESYDKQYPGKYHGSLADIRSRFYKDSIYSEIHKHRPQLRRIDWDYLLNVLLFLLIWCTAASWIIGQLVPTSSILAARIVQIVSFLLLTIVGIIRGIRMVRPGKQR